MDTQYMWLQEFIIAAWQLQLVWGAGAYLNLGPRVCVALVKAGRADETPLDQRDAYAGPQQRTPPLRSSQGAREAQPGGALLHTRVPSP